MVKPRPSLIQYGKFPTKDIGVINRIEMYRTKNAWWQRIYKPKYNVHMLALTKDAVYHMCDNCEYKFGWEK